MIAANLPDVDVLAFVSATPVVALRRGWTLVHLDFRSDEREVGSTPTGTPSVVDRSRRDQEGGLVAIPSSAGSAAAAGLPVACERRHPRTEARI